jgi:5'-phosphate synthase pdxT subunit
VLDGLGVESRSVRTAAELAEVDGLILPGGESTAILRLMEPEDLGRRIDERIEAGMPILATCAGVILLAESVEPEQPSLGVLEVDVIRNAYGRQVHSSVEEVSVAPGLGPPPSMEGVFIRAPVISRVGGAVEVLGRLGTDPVIVRQENLLAVTFHPELTSDHRIHELFVGMVEGRNG